MIRAAVRVLDVAAFQYVLTETVGVGQSEVEIAAAADCAVVLAVPSAGDEVQLMKAGLLESGDLYVVNRADEDAPGAARLARQLKLGLAHRRETAGEAPVAVISAKTGSGIPELVDLIMRVLSARDADGSLSSRRRRDHEREILELAMAEARARVTADRARLERLLDTVADRNRDPLSVALSLLDLSDAG